MKNEEISEIALQLLLDCAPFCIFHSAFCISI